MQDFLEKFKNELTGKELWLNMLDIIIISVLLYAVFAFFIKRNTKRLIKYVVIALIVCVLLSGKAMGLKMTGFLASQIVLIAIIGVAILFTPEIKRSLWRLSSPKISQEVYSTDFNCSEEDLRDTVDDIVRAAQNMSKKNVGALMVIAPVTLPERLLESGTKMDSILSSQLLECLFNTKAPLHDGAVFIRGNKILAAGCFLPLTESTMLDQELGTRHRAAIGVTETNNVLSVIVSEETGIISVASDGKISRYYDTDMLRDTLEQVYGLKAASGNNKKKRRKS